MAAGLGVKTDHIRPTLNSHPPFTAVGGYYREEAIMLLRRFYMSENSNGMDIASTNYTMG